jgi:hypothetical protein
VGLAGLDGHRMRADDPPRNRRGDERSDAMTQPEPPKEAPGSPLEASVAANRPDTPPEVPDRSGTRCWYCSCWMAGKPSLCPICGRAQGNVVTTDETQRSEIPE